MSIVKERRVSDSFNEMTRRYNDDLRKDTGVGDEQIIYWPENGQIEFNFIRGGRILGFRVLGKNHPPMFFSSQHVYAPKEASDQERTAIIERMRMRHRKRPFKGLDKVIAEAEAAAALIPDLK